MLKLENNIKVYVPIIRGREGAISYIRDIMSGAFGGTTEYRTRGSWIDNYGETIFDDIMIIESFTNKSMNDIKKLAAEYVETIKMDLKQEAVSIEINNILYII